jgi:hypothetical protein
MMAHSPIGASSYYRWKACPASVRLSEGLNSPDTPEAIQGNRAHDCAAIWIKNNLCPSSRFTDLEQEDFDAVEVYVDFVNSLRNEPDLRYWIETKFDLSNIYPGLYGTADFVCYSSRHEKLVVVDYKHGVGMPVEVKGSSQLQYYSVGAMLQLNLPVKSVELVIVQPRCPHPEGPIRKWQTTPKALQSFLDQLVSDAKRTADPEAELSVGDWCKFCPAAAVNCPAVREKSLELASESFSPALAYDPEKLSEVLKMLPVMESWIKNVRKFAVNEAQNGKIPPGFKIVGKRPQRKWKEGWTGERLAQEFGLKAPAMFDQRIRTPAQIEKMITKDLRPKVETLVDKISSGYKLVEDNDPEQGLLDSEIDSFTLIEF